MKDVTLRTLGVHDAGRPCEAFPEGMVPVAVQTQEASGGEKSDRSLFALWSLGR